MLRKYSGRKKKQEGKRKKRAKVWKEENYSNCWTFVKLSSFHNVIKAILLSCPTVVSYAIDDPEILQRRRTYRLFKNQSVYLEEKQNLLSESRQSVPYRSTAVRLFPRRFIKLKMLEE